MFKIDYYEQNKIDIVRGFRSLVKVKSTDWGGSQII